MKGDNVLSRIFKIIFISVIAFIFLPIIFLLIVITIIFLNLKPNKDIKKDLNLNLPEPSRRAIIYNYHYNGGSDFEIYYYDNLKKLENIKSFKVITYKEQNEIKNIINDYYDNLTENEKVFFNIHAKREKLYEIGNYYYYNKKHNIIFIIIEDKIYYLKKK